MTWTVPHTFVTGELVTASLANTHFRDQFLHLREYGAHCCVAYHSTSQTVTAGNTTALNLNSEVFDTGTMHDTSTNNNRIAFPVTGRYFVVGSSFVACNNNGAGALHLRLDGSNVNSFSVTSESADFGDQGAVVFIYLQATAGQYVDLAGTATTNDFTFGSSTASLATRLQVIGPFPF